jgi:competence protein CoiA
MKFAFVGAERREAEPGLSGKCPACGNALIAKCGDHRIWHWAHKGTRTCDAWWEPETEWHRGWKDHFPRDRQEVIHHSENGEKHIADVKTERGVVIEFQHSFLRREERESRETFYQNMVWVVDGQRRKRDRARLFESIYEAIEVNREPPIRSLQWQEGALLRDWAASRVPVYFDFEDSEGDTRLWRLNPHSPNGTYLSAVEKTLFLQIHLTGLPFDEMQYTKAVELTAANYYLKRQAARTRPLPDFERHMARRARRHFRL